jgi:hypothetical protein
MKVKPKLKSPVIGLLKFPHIIVPSNKIINIHPALWRKEMYGMNAQSRRKEKKQA